MNEIRLRNAKCAKWLDDMGVEHWTRFHSKGERYNLMSSNIAESLNAVLAKAKDFPITSMVEFIRTMLTRWFCLRQDVAAKSKLVITPEVDRLLVDLADDATKCSVVKASQWSVLVTSQTNKQFHVSIEYGQCTCKVFDRLKLPCCHAIAAAKFRGINPVTMCAAYYGLETWKHAYGGSVLPVPNSAEADEEVPQDLNELNLMPPLTRRPPGRPPKRRKKSAFEESGGFPTKRKKQNKCGRCRQEGHNKSTCKNPI